ncbi:MAG TPA: hypothetical protein VKF62_09265, partial [Planctomycetota bacterium]|nr:hypothetical protein [Planctomycetota bacterium]
VGAGSPVTPQVAGNGAAGDVFAVVALNGCPSLATTGRAYLDANAPEIVLIPFPAPGVPPVLDQDEVASLDEALGLQARKVPVYFSVDAATAAQMSATSGTPVTEGDILVSYRRGDWRVARSYAQLGLPAGADVDAIAIAESVPGEISQVYYSVRGPLGALSAGGLLPSAVYQPPMLPGTLPIVFLPPARMACLPTDDVDAMSILDPGQIPAGTCFLAIGPGPCTSAGALEEDPGGNPAATLWHPEGYCSWNGSYSVSGPFSTGVFTSIVGSPAAFQVFGNGLDDPITTESPLPGAFPFFGLSASDVQISLNGFVALDQNLSLGGGYFANDPIPNSNLPNNYLAPWWDDLHTGVSGSVWAQALPAGGFLVEWNSVEKFPPFTGGELATFQLLLSESPVLGTVSFLYGAQSFGGNSWDATIGIEDASGVLGIDVTGQGNNNSSFPSGFFPRIDLLPTGTPVSSPGGWAMAYNRGDLGLYDYNTPTANAGALVLPTAVPAGTKNLSLSFDYTKETEAGGTSAFDQCFVEARRTFPAGAAWQPLLPASLPTPIPGNSTCPFVTTVTESAAAPGSPLASFVGNGGSLRFRFDSIDNVANTYGGWTIDNLCLQGGPVAFFLAYGQGCVAGCPTGGGAYPRIGASAPPISPSTFSVTLTGGPPSGAAILLLQAPFSMP